MLSEPPPQDPGPPWFWFSRSSQPSRMDAFFSGCYAFPASGSLRVSTCHPPLVSVKATSLSEAQQSLRPHAKCLSSPIKSRHHRNGLTLRINKLPRDTKPAHRGCDIPQCCSVIASPSGKITLTRENWVAKCPESATTETPNRVGSNAGMEP